MCYPGFGIVHIKEPLLLTKRVAYVVAAGFLSHYLNGPLPYVHCHITVNKTFPSFLQYIRDLFEIMLLV